MVSVLQGLGTAGIWFLIVWLPIILVGRRHDPRHRLDRPPAGVASRHADDTATAARPDRGGIGPAVHASHRVSHAGIPPAWHDAPMTEQAERYDRIADGYARWWAPVLAPAVLELLDEAAPHLAAGAAASSTSAPGTGQLAIEALTRWPALSVVGIDASGEMRAMADAEADPSPRPGGPRAVRDHGRVRRRAPVRRTARSTSRCRPSSSSSSRTARVPCARSAAFCGPGRPSPTSRGCRTSVSSRPTTIFDDLLDELGIDAGDDDPGRPRRPAERGARRR